MFNGVFDDIPLGKVSFEYKIYVPIEVDCLFKQVKEMKYKASTRRFFNENYVLDHDLLIEDLIDIECFLSLEPCLKTKTILKRIPCSKIGSAVTGTNITSELKSTKKSEYHFTSTYNLNAISTRFNTDLEKYHYTKDLDMFLTIIKRLYQLKLYFLFAFSFNIINADGQVIKIYENFRSSQIYYDPNVFLQLVYLSNALDINYEFNPEINRIKEKELELKDNEIKAKHPKEIKYHNHNTLRFNNFLLLKLNENNNKENQILKPNKSYKLTISG